MEEAAIDGYAGRVEDEQRYESDPSVVQDWVEDLTNGHCGSYEAPRGCKEAGQAG